MVKGMDVIGKKTIEGSTHCSECKAASHHRNPIPSETHTHSDQVLGRVFSNICKVQTVTHEGFKYFITFIDDFSQFLTIYPIKNKSDMLEKFKEYLAEVEWQTSCKLKTLQMDSGGKIFFIRLHFILKEHQHNSWINESAYSTRKQHCWKGQSDPGHHGHSNAEECWV